jgi:hypothetical protein
MLTGMAAEDDVLDVVRGATARRRYVTALPHVPVKVLSGVSAFPVALWSSNSFNTFNTSALSKKVGGQNIIESVKAFTDAESLEGVLRGGRFAICESRRICSVGPQFRFEVIFQHSVRRRA